MRFARLLLPLAALAVCRAAPAPLKVKVVIVAMFEFGEDTGDRPGEFQLWVEREKLDRVFEFPGGYRRIRANRDASVIGIVTGAGVTSATSTIMALGADSRFDLTRAYWLIAGIAGADPEDASLGSAAWAEYVVDADLAYEVDAREAPPSWPYGRIAIGAKEPNRMPERPRENMMFQLNPKLVEWAYRLTLGTPLEDTPAMHRYRAQYTGMPNAMRPPFVLKGDSLGGSTFWHGRIMTRWANDWVKLWTGGKGNFVMTNMEDNGTALALTRLSGLGKVDFQRVLVLRTASNFCAPAPGQSATESLTRPYDGMLPSLESAYRVGSQVVHALVGNWAKWEARIPGE